MELNYPFTACKNVLAEALETMSETVALMSDFYTEDEQKSVLQKMLQNGKDVANTGISLSATKSAGENLLERTKKGDNSITKSNILEVFEAIYEEYLSNSNFAEFSNYSNFVEAVQSVSEANVTFGAGIEAVITEAIVSTFDPITKQPMVDPVKGAKCGHTYERFSIIELIKRKPKGTRCPYVGCNEKLTLRDLLEDEKMKLYLSQQRK